MKILFVGNSYIYYNDLPKLLDGLLNENGFEAQADEVTKGGRRLYENLAADDEKHLEILEKCGNAKYDVLILQEQSYFSLVDYEKFACGVLGVKDMVGAERTVLYATWGRKAGCDLLDEMGWSSEGMTNMLYEAYSMAAEASGSEISPVGLCFGALVKKHPDIELYCPDMSHPSYIGSCVAAIALYKSIVGKLPCNFSSLALNPQVLEAIKETV